MLFGADIIAASPTETEEHFADSVSLVEQAGLAFVHVFPFSPREGTPAARMPQLAKPVIKERAARLRAAAEATRTRVLAALVGSTQRVLLERDGRGRLDNFAEIALDGGQAGQIVEATVTGLVAGGLTGTLTGALAEPPA